MLCPAMPAREAAAQMRAAWGAAPDWLWVQHAPDQPAEAVGAAFAATFPGAALHLAAGWPGAQDGCPAVPGAEGAIGALGLWDWAGDYGTAAASPGADTRAAARAVLARALDRAGRPGDVPDLVWVSASPGTEALVVDELARILGDGVPIRSGPAAGRRRAVGPARVACGAELVVSVLFPGGAATHAPIGALPDVHAAGIAACQPLPDAIACRLARVAQPGVHRGGAAASRAISLRRAGPFAPGGPVPKARPHLPGAVPPHRLLTAPALGAGV